MEVANATLFTYLFFLLPLTVADSDSFLSVVSKALYVLLNFSLDVIINDFASVKARRVHL